jgi:hypothetical protein
VLADWGVSLASFAGLIATLDRRPSARSPISAWRIRNIVTSGLILTIAGFGIVAIYTATGEDTAMTVRIMSLLLVVAKSATLWRESRPGPEWPGERNRRYALGSTLAVLTVLLLNGFLGRLGRLQILFVVLLIDPISIFVRTVREVASGPIEAVAPSSTEDD